MVTRHRKMHEKGEEMTMGERRAALLSAIAVLVGLLVLGTGAIAFGFFNVAADAPDSRLTRFVVGLIRERAIDARADDIRVPALDKAKMISEGAGHYDEMCIGCHLAPGMKENEMRPGLNPKPPVLAAIPAEEPAEQFWVVKHGIKMTAMPAWGLTHSDEEIWNIVAFLQKLPKLSPQQYRALVGQAGSFHDHDHMND